MEYFLFLGISSSVSDLQVMISAILANICQGIIQQREPYDDLWNKKVF